MVRVVGKEGALGARGGGNLNIVLFKISDNVYSDSQTRLEEKKRGPRRLHSSCCTSRTSSIFHLTLKYSP